MIPNKSRKSRGNGAPQRDYTVMVMIAGLSLAQIGILYVLIVVETPITPAVRKALTQPLGIFAVVISVVSVLSMCMAGILTWIERRARRDAPSDRQSSVDSPPPAH